MENICLNAGNLGSTPSQRETTLLCREEMRTERGEMEEGGVNDRCSSSSLCVLSRASRHTGIKVFNGLFAPTYSLARLLAHTTRDIFDSSDVNNFAFGA